VAVGLWQKCDSIANSFAVVLARSGPPIFSRVARQHKKHEHKNPESKNAIISAAASTTLNGWGSTSENG